MDKLRIESEYIKNMLEDEINKDNIYGNIEQILKDAYDLLQISLTMSYEEYKDCLINISKNYKDINYTEENILTYITLVEYFMLNIQDDFFNYIVDEYIINNNKYYKLLYTRYSINYYLIKKIGEKNEISDRTFKYLLYTNKQLPNEITKLYSQTITQCVLNKFTNVTNLNINYNENITYLNHFKNLKELDISGCHCAVEQYGITKLKSIKILNLHDNLKITDINHLQQLEELDISGYHCRITQNGISNLTSIKILNAFDNDNIMDVSHLNNLQEVYATVYLALDSDKITESQKKNKFKIIWN